MKLLAYILIGISLISVGLPGQLQPEQDDYARALEAFRNKEYLQAMLTARTLTRQRPDDAPVRHLYGLALGAVGQFSDAVSELEKAVELAPDQAGYRHDLAMTLLRGEREPEAIGHLEVAVQLNPDNLMGRLYLGRLYHNRNQSQDALTQFEEIRKRDDAYPTVHYHIARIHQNEGNAEAAIRELKTEVKHFPANPLPRVELAELLLKTGQLNGALEELEAMARLSDQHGPRYHWLLAKVRHGLGELEAAIAAATESVRLDPKFAAGHYLLSRLYQEAGREAESKQAMEMYQRTSQPVP